MIEAKSDNRERWGFLTGTERLVMGYTILIVDDNPDDIEITKMALAEQGRRDKVDAVRSGEAALKLVESGSDLPSLILLDLKTPGMSGIDTLRRIRADGRLRSIPVIMVTNSTFQRHEQEAYDAGADGFLHKAIDMDKFGSDLNSLLQRFLT
jgi:two-component system, response regulator